MQFEYFAGEQRTPEWFALRLGKVTASRLKDWLAVSKAAKTKGAPLKARLDYEKELMFERQFNTSFENFVSKAMQDGIDFETFVIEQYEKQTKTTVYAVGGWYNDFFMASPDGGIGAPEDVAVGKVEGIVEVKVLKDKKFTDVLMNDTPEDHYQQIQGQLRASGAKYCDYLPANLNTKKFKIVRVTPDMEFHQFLDLSVQEKLVVDEFKKERVYDFVDEIPATLLNSTLAEEELADF